MFSINTSTPAGLIYCALIALGFGILTAFVYAIKSNYSKNMLITLVILPVIVDVVLTIINGSIGVGIAIAGTFGLVRFRSVPGSAKEICYIFLSMANGLMCSAGQVGYGGIVLGAVLVILLAFKFIPIKNNGSCERDVRITVPESLNYTEAFTEIFNKYAFQTELVKVKTTNMGSTFDLTFSIIMKDPKKEKEMIDEIRIRNGNLPVMSSISAKANEL